MEVAPSFILEHHLSHTSINQRPCHHHSPHLAQLQEQVSPPSHYQNHKRHTINCNDTHNNAVNNEFLSDHNEQPPADFERYLDEVASTKIIIGGLHLANDTNSTNNTTSASSNSVTQLKTELVPNKLDGGSGEGGGVSGGSGGVSGTGRRPHLVSRGAEFLPQNSVRTNQINNNNYSSKRSSSQLQKTNRYNYIHFNSCFVFTYLFFQTFK